MTTSAPETAIAARRQRGLFTALVVEARPKQWSKNILVFTAPAAAGSLLKTSAIQHSLLAFAIFCAVATGTYFLNDSVDVNADRLHPTKRLRPIAAGEIPLGAGFALSGLLLVGGCIASWLLVNWHLAVVMAIYVAVQLAYSFWLKHEAILDMACVASSYVLRAVAGGVAVGVPISQWFLIVTTFGSLLMVSGKRLAEHSQLGDRREAHRATLAVYTQTFLRSTLVLSATVAITAYFFWAFEKQAALPTHADPIWYQLSIAPFVLAMLRYAFIVESGGGGQPEDVVLRDRPLQIMGVIWVAVFALGVYAS